MSLGELQHSSPISKHRWKQILKLQAILLWARTYRTQIGTYSKDDPRKRWIKEKSISPTAKSIIGNS